MNANVKEAVEEIRQNYPGLVEIEEDGDGGAYVIVNDVTLGEVYEQESTWVGFRITFQYPNADVYPHFVRGDLRRKDSRPLGEALTSSQFRTKTAIQISRRSNRLNPSIDTAMLKLEKVLTWLRSRQ